MSGRRLRPLVALLALVLVATVAACGIPKDSQPHLIAEEPEGFATTTRPANVGGGTVNVFLIDSEADPPRLAQRQRSTTQSPGPLEAVDSLLAALTDDDQTDGFATKIPPGTTLRADSEVRDGVVFIDLSADIEKIALSSDTAVQAYAQLVYTATQFSQKSVQFMTEGKPVEVPTDGESASDVTRTDYQDLMPES